MDDQTNESGQDTSEEELRYTIAIKAVQVLDKEEWKYLAYTLGVDLDRLRQLTNATMGEYKNG